MVCILAINRKCDLSLLKLRFSKILPSIVFLNLMILNNKIETAVKFIAQVGKEGEKVSLYFRKLLKNYEMKFVLEFLRKWET
jgi:hypothetical protein